MLAEASIQQLHAFVYTFSKEELVWIGTEITDTSKDLLDRNKN